MRQCFYGSFDDGEGYHVLAGDDLPDGLSDFIKRNSEVCGLKEGPIGQKILTMLPYNQYYVFFHYTRLAPLEGNSRPTDFLHQLIFEAGELESRLKQDNFFLAHLRFCEHLSEIYNYGDELWTDTRKQLEVSYIDGEVFKEMLKRLLRVENKKQLFLVFPDDVAQDNMDEKSRIILSVLLHRAGRDAWANMSFSTWSQLTIGNDLIRRLSIVCCTMNEARKYYETYPDKACYFLTDENRFWEIAETRPCQDSKALSAGAKMNRGRIRAEGDFSTRQMERDEVDRTRPSQDGEKSSGDPYGGVHYKDNGPLPPWGDPDERDGRSAGWHTNTFLNEQKKQGSDGAGQMKYDEGQMEKRMDLDEEVYTKAFRLFSLSAVCLALSIFMFLGTIIMNLNGRKQGKEQTANAAERVDVQNSSSEMKALAIKMQELERGVGTIERMLKEQQMETQSQETQAQRQEKDNSQKLTPNEAPKIEDDLQNRQKDLEDMLSVD